MPELPEVETLCRQLRPVIVDRQILSSRVIDPKLEHLPPLAGKTVRSVSRHGKQMVWTLSDGMCLVFQLRMTGRFFWMEKDGIPPHARLELTFRGGRLVLSDPRRFATVQLCSPPAPSACAGRPRKARAEAASPRRPAGGGFPSSPSSWIRRSSPASATSTQARSSTRRASTRCARPAVLTAAEWKKIAAWSTRILEKAVKSRGTSISDWRDLYAGHGEYQRQLRVYGRKGEPCIKCRCAIQRIVIAGRSTFLLSRCQT